MHRFIRATGPVLTPLAGRRIFPLWAVVHHVGRKSGRAYNTPVVARRTADGFIIPMPFGTQTQWAQNLLASGRGEVVLAGQTWPVVDPRPLDWAAANTAFGRIQRFALARFGIRQFLAVRVG